MQLPVITPALIAERWISRQSDSPLPHTADAERVGMNSGSTNAMHSLVRACADCVRPLDIPDDGPGHERGCTLRQEYWYNEGNGNVTEQYRNQLSGTGADTVGWRMLCFAGGGFTPEGRVGELTGFLARVCVRFTGNQTEKHKDKRSRI